MRIASVCFSGSAKLYHYYCPFPSVVVGDIVDTPTGKAEVRNLTNIIQTGELPDFKILVGYTSRVTGEVIRLGSRNQVTAAPSSRAPLSIITELEKRRQIVEAIKNYSPVAKSDKKAAALLKELKEHLK